MNFPAMSARLLYLLGKLRIKNTVVFVINIPGPCIVLQWIGWGWGGQGHKETGIEFSIEVKQLPRLAVSLCICVHQ